MTGDTHDRGHDDGDIGPAIDALEHEFVRFFARARTLWKTAAAEVDPELQPVGYKLLATLHREGPRRAGDLAARTGTDKSVVSRQLRFLESRELVESMPDPDDGRSRIHAATADAARRLEAGSSRLRARGKGWLAGWPRERVETFTSLLAELNTGLDALDDTDGPGPGEPHRTEQHPGADEHGTSTTTN